MKSKLMYAIPWARGRTVLAVLLTACMLVNPIAASNLAMATEEFENDPIQVEESQEPAIPMIEPVQDDEQNRIQGMDPPRQVPWPGMPRFPPEPETKAVPMRCASPVPFPLLFGLLRKASGSSLPLHVHGPRAHPDAFS